MNKLVDSFIVKQTIFFFIKVRIDLKKIKEILFYYKVAVVILRHKTILICILKLSNKKKSSKFSFKMKKEKKLRSSLKQPVTR